MPVLSGTIESGTITLHTVRGDPAGSAASADTIDGERSVPRRARAGPGTHARPSAL
eukprot:SAG31_NODE_47898_length_209_cov_3.809091_1_plen_55_part_10